MEWRAAGALLARRKMTTRKLLAYVDISVMLCSSERKSQVKLSSWCRVTQYLKEKKKTDAASPGLEVPQEGRERKSDIRQSSSDHKHNTTVIFSPFTF